MSVTPLAFAILDSNPGTHNCSICTKNPATLQPQACTKGRAASNAPSACSRTSLIRAWTTASEKPASHGILDIPAT